MTATAEAPAPLLCQREADRFATRTETATDRAARIRKNATQMAVRMLGTGPEGRCFALDVMFDALHDQAPLTFRRPDVYFPLREPTDFGTTEDFAEWLGQVTGVVA